MTDSNVDKEDAKVRRELDVMLYRTAFERLSFQDEYLFKFTAIFTAAHGGLAYLTVSASSPASLLPPVTLLYAVGGLVLSWIWEQWTIQNDYWHSVWSGILRKSEIDFISLYNNRLQVFSACHCEIAREGGRRQKPYRGHKIAAMLANASAIGWATILVGAFSSLLS